MDGKVVTSKLGLRSGYVVQVRKDKCAFSDIIIIMKYSNII